MNVFGRSNLEATSVLGLTGAAAILVIGAFVPVSATVQPDVQLAFSVFLATVLLWITKPVPYTISSILCVILLYTLGVAPTFEAATVGFASNLVFFMVLLLLIGKSVAKVDLDEWVATLLVSPESTPKSSIRRLAATILLLAFIMPSGTARTATFFPIVDRVNELYNIDNDSQFRRFAYYVIGHLNPVGSLALMTGGGMAIAASALTSSIVRPITWVEWALYMTPPIVLLFTIGIAAASFVYDVDDDRDLQTREVRTDGSIDGIDGAPESLTRDQLIVVGTLLTATCFWIVGSFVGVSTIIPGMFVVLVFSLPGVRIVTAEEVRSINWGIIFLIGTMLSLLEVMQDLNAFDFLISGLASVLPLGAPTAVVLLMLFFVAIFVRTAFSSVSAAFLVMFPILLEFATLLEVNQLYLSFGLAILLMSTTLLPFNNATVLISYEQGPLTMRDVAVLGLLTLAFAFVIVALSWTLYWPFVDAVSPL
ncbi:SLC13 family permease [Natrialba asiatica]|uniref:Sodium/sulfate symporter n=1 Tax=Natrialba asiatica (strain ATCC 700177 / DSM 12278 / JCM 9576 / FERM P-10747 / NBRC 102637 / 172P1) TaxID=29540 RepID=M0AEY4_NATA1|nr:SLC13 family permease [Natrialba asiatica]ELY97079.1 sodium/sulfate symporter [Natrialba asiatica DSM 12278]